MQALKMNRAVAVQRPSSLVGKGLPSRLFVKPVTRTQQRITRVSQADPPALVSEPVVPSVSVPVGGDPWGDEKWKGMKWTVFRGKAYDLTPYMAKHPGGKWLLNLAVKRDCTALFESYHLRPEVAVAMVRRLPELKDFPIYAVPQSPYPNDSDIYNTIRERVKKEVFKGTEIKGAHRSGSEWAALVILAFGVFATCLYATSTTVLTGAILGLAGAWIGLTVQHCGNHGAMSTSPFVNMAMGLCSDLIGGASLMWRYHHQVSHHIHCNDDGLDEDVLNAYPILRFDHRMPKFWYHQFQHIYMWVTFPFLVVSFQAGDLIGLFTNRTIGATLYGADNWERLSLIIGKVLHYSILFGIPFYYHGLTAALVGSASYLFVQGVVLATTFAVSHNVPESKPVQAGPTQDILYTETLERDWAVQQILTSANWGGVIGNFFTGGLNLQIEHHLFPAISFMHYPAIAAIVEDECNKRGVQYAKYPTLPEIVGRFVRYMKEVGVAAEVPRPLSSNPHVMSRF
uniref:Chloroplast delta-6 fatty acid desaturase n=1 Tax=Chlamydomonas sp. ICE-L TaxID=309537 RepID=I7C1C3_9CHLO|nr:chloroplast delta-6 fatty acid desaturase [Chlamydomonas sp. ICE-L]|eukprot:gene13427-19282_t